MVFILPYFNVEDSVSATLQVDISGGVKKKRPAGNDPGDRPTKENPDQGRLAPDTTTRMYRGYTIGVRGEIPGDIVERVSKLHGAALSKNTSTGVRAEAGNDTPDNKEDEDGDTTQVPVPEL